VQFQTALQPTRGRPRALVPASLRGRGQAGLALGGTGGRGLQLSGGWQHYDACCKYDMKDKLYFIYCFEYPQLCCGVRRRRFTAKTGF